MKLYSGIDLPLTNSYLVLIRKLRMKIILKCLLAIIRD